MEKKLRRCLEVNGILKTNIIAVGFISNKNIKMQTTNYLPMAAQPTTTFLISFVCVLIWATYTLAKYLGLSRNFVHKNLTTYNKCDIKQRSTQYSILF